MKKITLEQGQEETLTVNPMFDMPLNKEVCVTAISKDTWLIRNEEKEAISIYLKK